MDKQDFRGIIILAGIPVWVQFTWKKQNKPLQEDLVSVPSEKLSMFIRFFQRSWEMKQRKHASVQQHPPRKSLQSPSLCWNVFSFLLFDSISKCRWVDCSYWNWCGFVLWSHCPVKFQLFLYMRILRLGFLVFICKKDRFRFPQTE